MLKKNTHKNIANVFNSSGHIDGTYIDSVGDQKREVQSGRAYNFDGAITYVQLPNSPVFNLLDFTISVKFVAGSINNTRIFSKDNILDVGIRKLISLKGNSLGSGRPGFGIVVDQVVLAVEGPTALIPGQHYTMTAVRKDGEYMRIYINGVLVGQLSTPTPLGPIDSNIGPTLGNFKSNTRNGEYFDGVLYDVRVYNIIKTTKEIQNIQDGGIDTVGLVAHYKGDEGAGTISYDSSGNGLHGAILNGTQHIELMNGFGSDFQNQLGYTENSGVLIPRNESIPTQDVLGNNLQYSGRVKYNGTVYGRYNTFNGNNQYISIPNNAGIMNGDSCTVSIKFKLDSYSTSTQYIFWKYIFSEIKGFVVGMWGTNSDLQQGEIFLGGRANQSGVGGFYLLGSGVIAELGKRYHIVAMKDGDTTRFYLNKVLIAERTASNQVGPISNSGSVIIGGGDGGPGPQLFFDGDIADVRFWNNGITDQLVIDRIFDGEVIGDEDLHLKLEEGAGTTVYNSGTVNITGTRFNGVGFGEGLHGSKHYNTGGYTQSGSVLLSRKGLSNNDVLGNPLQYTANGGMLPAGSVSFPNNAPEIIKQNVPTVQQYRQRRTNIACDMFGDSLKNIRIQKDRGQKGLTFRKNTSSYLRSNNALVMRPANTPITFFWKYRNVGRGLNDRCCAMWGYNNAENFKGIVVGKGGPDVFLIALVNNFNTNQSFSISRPSNQVPNSGTIQIRFNGILNNVNSVDLFINGVIATGKQIRDGTALTTNDIQPGTGYNNFYYTRNLAGNYVADGTLSEISIVNYAKSDEEILKDYNNGTQKRTQGEYLFRLMPQYPRYKNTLNPTIPLQETGQGLSISQFGFSNPMNFTQDLLPI